MASLINKDNLAHYLKLNYNVIFRGRHGVGKTAIIKEVFEAAGLKWKYFSTSTLDPWVDFVGTPRVVDDPTLGSYLDLVKPLYMKLDEYDAFFFDEYNRAPDKVINATMELIQFGSINGHKLNNLKVIWAAINPEDEEDTYSVNHLDPAHIDRFQVQIDVPYKIDDTYFMAKYPAIGRTFIDWWKGLPQDIRFDVSPRRLDYAADAYMNKCRLEDFLPVKSNVKALRDLLKTMPFLDRINSINTEEEAITFVKDVNNTQKLLELLQTEESTTKEFFKKYAKLIPKEYAAPFVECLEAKRAGFETFSSIAEMIEKLPGDKGTAYVGGLINNIDLQGMYAASKSPSANLSSWLHANFVVLSGSTHGASQHHLIRKLANRVSDVINGCNSATVMRMMWGSQGKTGNSPTNLQIILSCLGRVDDAFSQMQKDGINKVLFDNNIVDSRQFLP